MSFPSRREKPKKKKIKNKKSSEGFTLSSPWPGLSLIFSHQPPPVQRWVTLKPVRPASGNPRCCRRVSCCWSREKPTCRGKSRPASIPEMEDALLAQAVLAAHARGRRSPGKRWLVPSAAGSKASLGPGSQEQRQGCFLVGWRWSQFILPEKGAGPPVPSGQARNGHVQPARYPWITTETVEIKHPPAGPSPARLCPSISP